MWVLFSTVVLLFLKESHCSLITREVVSRFGTIKGVTEEVTFRNVTRKYTKFLSIPYAEAPVGDLRFRKPVGKPPLTSPYDATFNRLPCAQTKLSIVPDADYSEDCLHLSIYIPEIEAGKADRLPVMVYIHGGALQVGGANFYSFDTLCTQGNVIVVGINYRLAVFGFLSTSDDASRGNYGLWDQHMAIKWVHDYIADFGGDTGRITLFGQSAGAASVSYQALYPSNKGLFQRIIAESGGPECHWAFNKSPDHTAYAAVLGCDRSTSEDLVDCLRSKTTEELMTALADPPVPFLTYGFAAVRDGDFIKKDPCQLVDYSQPLSEEQYILASLDFLAGLTDMEGGYHGLLQWPDLLGTDVESYRVTRQQFQNIVVPKVLTQLFVDDRASPAVNEAILFQYTNWTDPKNMTKVRDMLLQLSGDYAFVYPTVKLADAHSQFSKEHFSYFYEFSAPAPPYMYFYRPEWLTGVVHGDDTIFRLGFSERHIEANYRTGWNIPSAADLELAETVIAMWTNFAKTGDPNEPVPLPVMWPKYTSEGREYLDITHNLSTSSAKRRFGEPWVSFWLELVPSILKCNVQTSDSITNKEEPHTEL